MNVLIAAIKPTNDSWMNVPNTAGARMVHAMELWLAGCAIRQFKAAGDGFPSRRAATPFSTT